MTTKATTQGRSVLSDESNDEFSLMAIEFAKERLETIKAMPTVEERRDAGWLLLLNIVRLIADADDGILKFTRNQEMLDFVEGDLQPILLS